MRRLLVLTCAMLLAAPSPSGAQPHARLLVRFESDTSAQQRSDMRGDAGVVRDANLAVKGLELVEPRSGVRVQDAISTLQHMHGILYVERDHPIRQTAVPNDPLYPVEWGLATIHAPDAWDVITGSRQVTVAVVDSGMDLTHPDLAPNLYTNPGESGGGRETNGVDDDGDGRIDDVHGWDFVDGDNQPEDGDGHGTHVAGTIGARGDDGAGVAGVVWSTMLMALRVLDNNGNGFVSDAVRAFGFAGRSGARIVNASLGGGFFSRAERDAIAAAPETLFVVAAGNDGANVDATPAFPCDYSLPNVVCVAATDESDALASFSNFGATNVDLAAPGVDIASTWPGGRFALLSGTSMATPHVSGAAALLLAHDPGLTTAGLRAALLSSVDPVADLAGRVATGGRLDVAAALAVPVPAPQPAPQPAAPPPPVVVPKTPAQAADRVAPGVALTINRIALRRLARTRRLRLALSASEACRVTIEVWLDARAARRLHLRSRVLGRATVHLTAAGKRSIRVRLSARAARALRTAARLRVLAVAVAVDASGNRRTARRTATLRR